MLLSTTDRLALFRTALAAERTLLAIEVFDKPFDVRDLVSLLSGVLLGGN